MGFESESLNIFENDCPKKKKKTPPRQQNMHGHVHIVIISGLGERVYVKLGSPKIEILIKKWTTGIIKVT